MSKWVIASVVVLMAASMAPADLVVNLVWQTVSYNNHTYYQCKVYLHADTTHDIATAFDGRWDGNMSQWWYREGGGRPRWEPTVNMEDFYPGDPQGVIDTDSHLVVPVQGRAVVSEPIEDNNATAVPDAWCNGIGSALFGASTETSNMVFGILPAYETMDLFLAQIVLSSASDSVHMTGHAASYDYYGGYYGLTVDTWIQIPEPGAMVLVTVGGILTTMRRHANKGASR